MGNELVKIIEGVTLLHFNAMVNLLDEIRTATTASTVSMRLNESEEEDRFPFFVGWVEDGSAETARINKRIPHPGLFRFGDDTNSKVYRDVIKTTVANGPGPNFVTKDWSLNYNEKTMGAKVIAKDTNLIYQKFIGIIVDDGTNGRRCRGMLGVAFPDQAAADAITNLNATLENRAQSATSALIVYIKDNFVWGGPIC